MEGVEIERSGTGDVDLSTEAYDGVKMWLPGLMGLLCNQEESQITVEASLKEGETLLLRSTVGIGEEKVASIETERHKQ